MPTLTQQEISVKNKRLKLLPNEKVKVIVEHPTAFRSDYELSAIRELMRLTGVSQPQQIGLVRPSFASLSRNSLEDNSTPQHLKLYEAVFGRDSLQVAEDTVELFPELAKTTLLFLAGTQGVAFNAEREEEPGKIVHEVRMPHDPIAQQITSERGWGWPYYGAVDATPKFVKLLVRYCKLSKKHGQFLTETYTDRLGETRTMQHALESSLDWIKNKVESNDDGLVEYRSTIPGGIENQVWKDSWDSYHHADGTIADHQQGIASLEVQVLAYDALKDTSELQGNTFLSAELDLRAETLKKTILEKFWVEDKQKGGYFALGTDRDSSGNVRQLRIRTSNMGHVLNSRLLIGTMPDIQRKRELVIRHLFSPEMLNVSGIRTLASDEVRFRPCAYHNGSVWPWDTHYIANGLRRHSYYKQADDLDKRILFTVKSAGMFPEYVSGGNEPAPSTNSRTLVVYDEVHQKDNRVEQPPQEVQAWTVSAVIDAEHKMHTNNYLAL